MSVSRRILLAATASGAIAAPSVVNAQASWRSQFATLNVGIVPAENQAGVMTRFQGLASYLQKALGVGQVKLHTAGDYAGTIEAMRAKRLELAFFGPASYAKAFEVSNGNVDPLVIETDINGKAFYNSVIIVRADSPYRAIEDLKGKTIAFADPNSTSGYVVPVFYLTQQGRPPQSFFGKTGFGGGHDNAAIAVVNGQYDAAANWWRVGDDSAFHRIMARGLIPRDSLRIIWTSPDIPESPWTARKELPGEMREAMRRAMLDLPNADPETFRTMTEGKSKGFVPASHQQFEGIIEMIKFNEAQRRKAS